jgi:hypothetical protein
MRGIFVEDCNGTKTRGGSEAPEKKGKKMDNIETISVSI